MDRESDDRSSDDVVGDGVGSVESPSTTARTTVTFLRGPSAAGEACLVRIYPPGEALGRQIPLTEPVEIGRDPATTLVIDHHSVSRRHARIVDRGAHKVILDLASTNGTYVNDVRVKEHTLESGDLIRVGNTILKFLHGSIEALYYEEIYRLTIIDGLTGAYNNRYLLEHLDREVARCRRHARPLAILLMDLDHFKSINDTHGHLCGDYVLREFSALVRARIRREEVFARYGGEEFTLVVPETTAEAAVAAADALRLAIAEHRFVAEDVVIPVTVSIGIGMLDRNLADAHALLQAADTNLYRAKQAGRNQVVASAQ